LEYFRGSCAGSRRLARPRPTPPKSSLGEFTIERLAGERLQAQVRRMALTLVGFLLLGAIVAGGFGFWGGSSWRGARMMNDCRAHQSTDPSGRHG
jgi:hypothetical protein